MYLKEAVRELPARGLTGSVGWESPSNIALVKYWGKKAVQIPMNPSVSFTLKNAVTRSHVDFAINRIRKGLIVDYSFEGEKRPDFAARITGYLKSITPWFPFLEHAELKIRSENSFPHSSGIASSASAFSALALCLVEIENKLRGNRSLGEKFLKKASFFARLGSGSACRSVYPGAALWGETEALPGSSAEYAMPLQDHLHETFAEYRDTILIIDPGKKKVSSTAGHGMMDGHPYAGQRFAQAAEHTVRMLEILKRGETDDFVELVEYEALNLHAMMLSSRPGYFLLEPNTLAALRSIREWRQETGNPVAFTLDAGANVHVLYPLAIKDQADLFINESLRPLCAGDTVIDDQLGNGPQKI